MQTDDGTKRTKGFSETAFSQSVSEVHHSSANNVAGMGHAPVQGVKEEVSISSSSPPAASSILALEPGNADAVTNMGKIPVAPMPLLSESDDEYNDDIRLAWRLAQEELAIKAL